MTPDNIGPGSTTGSVTIGSPASGPDSVEEEDGRTASLEENGRPDVVELDSIRRNDELEGATEELDSSYTQSQGFPLQEACSEDDDTSSTTSPLVAEVVSHAVSAAPANAVTADIPSIEASLFCEEVDHLRFADTLFFLIIIVTLPYP